MNQKTLFFSSLLQRAGDDMKKQFFFICGDGLTRSIHVQHNYYDYHYLGDDATLRCGGGVGRRSHFHCVIINGIENNYHSNLTCLNLTC